MAYYDALIAAWNGATQPPAGVTGTAITGGMTTVQKLAAVNAWTLPDPQPAILKVTDVINAILPADFLGLTALQLQELQFELQGGTLVNGSPGTTIRSVFQTIFTGKATTLANLSALVSPYDNHVKLWITANGYQQLTPGDALAAGLS